MIVASHISRGSSGGNAIAGEVVQISLPEPIGVEG